MTYSVQELADIAGVSVRTLHYYDQINLLHPSREGNGYRTYEEDDLMRLQQILFYRELDLPLEEIRSILDDATFDMMTALQEHRDALEKRKQRLERLLDTIDKTTSKISDHTEMSDNELFESFWKKHNEEYAEEAKERWGHTDAYKQSVKRTKNMTKEDMKRIAQKGEELTAKIAACIPHGPKSRQVQVLIAEHYRSLQTFYDPSPELYRGLGQMYCDDHRFRAYYEKYDPSLPEFMCDAMEEFCRRMKN